VEIVRHEKEHAPLSEKIDEIVEEGCDDECGMHQVDRPGKPYRFEYEERGVSREGYLPHRKDLRAQAQKRALRSGLDTHHCILYSYLVRVQLEEHDTLHRYDSTEATGL
jgi:hypothetical protein